MLCLISYNHVYDVPSVVTQNALYQDMIDITLSNTSTSQMD